MHIFISVMPISSPNPMFYHLLESSHRDNPNKWSNIGFGEEIAQVESIEFHFMHLICVGGTLNTTQSINLYVKGTGPDLRASSVTVKSKHWTKNE